MRSAERQHYGLAVMCARRFQNRGVEMDELVSEAEAALLFAAARFDESRNVRFSTYAIPVVLGALRQLCRQSAPMHVPRDDVRVLAQAQKARQQLLAQTGREPEISAIAQMIGVDPARLSMMLAADERMRSLCTVDDGDASRTGFEDAVLLRDAVRRLPNPFGQVVWLRYGMGLTQTEIAQKLGVGQSAVSRWEKKGIEMLRGQM